MPLGGFRLQGYYPKIWDERGSLTADIEYFGEARRHVLDQRLGSEVWIRRHRAQSCLCLVSHYAKIYPNI